MICWRILKENKKNKAIEFYNVFDCPDFLAGIVSALETKVGRGQIAEKVHTLAFSLFWEKEDWIVSLGGKKKMDAFAQLEANWEPFIDYVMRHKRNIIDYCEESVA